MVFNTILNNISVLSWRSVLLVEETRVPGQNHDLSQVTDNLYHKMLYRVHPGRCLDTLILDVGIWPWGLYLSVRLVIGRLTFIVIYGTKKIEVFAQ